jgi:hypothetical protein
LQADCSYNREKFDSYGRRKRRAIEEDRQNAIGGPNATNSDLTLSQEILVLDFNEELPSNVPKYSMPTDSLNANYIEPNPSFGNNNNFNHNNRRSQHSQNRESFGPSFGRDFGEAGGAGESCPTRNSVLVLSVVCGMLLLLYIASAVCFMAKSRPWRASSMGHSHHKHIIQ